MKRLLVLVAVSLFTIPLFGQDEAGNQTAAGPAVDTTGKGYTSAYVIEPATRRVLFAENEHLPLPTASMAKMMTLLVTLDEIAAGRLQWDTPIVVSPNASRMGGSQVYLRDGATWPVKNLVIATMVHSANDAAQALADRIGGSSEGFADLMNQKAEQLGLEHSRFFDPHGLPARDPSRNDVQCAHDLAITGIELMKHPFMRQLAVIPEMDFRNGTLERIYNPNHLVNPKRPNYMADATGIKTGYTVPAGYCITASAKRGDLELVAVVMGAKPPRGPLSSFGIASRLFNEAFSQYRIVTAVQKGTVVGQATVSKGRAETVPVVAAEDVKALVKRGEEKSVKVAFSGGTLAAPVKAGQPAGTIVVTAGESQNKVPAVAGAAVEKQAAWRAFWPF
ncbi:MAG TPA: D-alanyl-D-alanine carboxypeptidase family protein [Thermoanaerobaculia bacterium]|nr:D-alanyl-D-alanine carboxypeptidase family protein [Thermoanaerobaculia bacterium]